MQREADAIVAIEECAKILIGQQRCRSQGKADAPNEQQAQNNSAIKINKTKISLIYMQNARALLAAAVKLLCALLAAAVKLRSALLAAVKPCC